MKTKECKRCCGTGKVGNFAHVKNGVCFSCNGTGRRVVMKRAIVQQTFHYAVCELNGTKVSRDTQEDAQALVMAWLGMNVPAHYESKTAHVTMMVQA